MHSAYSITFSRSVSRKFAVAAYIAPIIVKTEQKRIEIRENFDVFKRLEIHGNCPYNISYEHVVPN